jgi:DNA-binding response OmpR family regulator
MRNRVLLADPDEQLLASYREFLLRDGFDVMTATDALDCVAKLRSFPPDVLVLDPALPWGQGEGVLAMMYEDPRVPLVPVMIVTGNEDPQGRYGVGVFPVGAYHVKPLAAPFLAESLHRLLRKDVVLRRPRQIPLAACAGSAITVGYDADPAAP